MAGFNLSEKKLSYCLGKDEEQTVCETDYQD